eukprot:TRINITY_DN19424_c1_g3_i1.p1 TRINITY_DN19424_c1_g3~~TRINITY_DN19424_c1_g3_i1.p1  ORF type:complete len:853 (-),score=127.17 TRINITY_DN19424_c1_g3_i1:25-2583(-)
MYEPFLAPNSQADVRHSNGLAQHPDKVSSLQDSVRQLQSKWDQQCDKIWQGLADNKKEIDDLRLECTFSKTTHDRKLTERFDALERQLQDALVVSRRTADLELQLKGVTGRTDQLESLLKEEQGRRSNLFDSLSSVEVLCQDLRKSQLNTAEVQVATEQLMKGDMQRRMEMIQEDMNSIRNTSAEHAHIVSQTGQLMQNSFDDTSRRLAEVGQHMRELQTDAMSLRAQVEHSIRGCDAQAQMFDDLTLQMREDRSTVSQELAAFQDELQHIRAEQSSSMMQFGQANSNIVRNEDEYRELVARVQSFDDLSAQMRVDKVAVSQTVASFHDELRHIRAEQSSSLVQLEQAIANLTRKEAECQRPATLVQTNDDETRHVQEHTSAVSQKLASFQDELQLIRADQSSSLKRFEQADASLTRNEEECRKLAARVKFFEDLTSQMSEDRLVVSQKFAFVHEELQQLRADQSLRERVEETVVRMEHLEQSTRSLSTKVQKACPQNEGTSQPPVESQANGGQLENDVNGLQSDVAKCQNDVGQLTYKLEKLRKEHDQALNDLGALTKTAADAATIGIRRAEERIEQAVSAHMERARDTIAAHDDAKSDPSQGQTDMMIDQPIEEPRPKAVATEKTLWSESTHLADLLKRHIGRLEVMQGKMPQQDLLERLNAHGQRNTMAAEGAKHTGDGHAPGVARRALSPIAVSGLSSRISAVRSPSSSATPRVSSVKSAGALTPASAANSNGSAHPAPQTSGAPQLYAVCSSPRSPPGSTESFRQIWPVNHGCASPRNPIQTPRHNQPAQTRPFSEPMTAAATPNVNLQQHHSRPNQYPASGGACTMRPSITQAPGSSTYGWPHRAP